MVAAVYTNPAYSSTVQETLGVQVHDPFVIDNTATWSTLLPRTLLKGLLQYVYVLNAKPGSVHVNPGDR